MKKKDLPIIGIAALVITATVVIIKKIRDLDIGKAPQLDIHNPGSQDDFPKPPTEGEMG